MLIVDILPHLANAPFATSGKGRGRGFHQRQNKGLSTSSSPAVLYPLPEGRGFERALFDKSESDAYVNMSGDLSTREIKTHRFNLFLKETPSCKTQYTIEKIVNPTLSILDTKVTHEFQQMKDLISKKGKFDC